MTTGGIRGFPRLTGCPLCVPPPLTQMVPPWLDLGFDYQLTYGMGEDADHSLDIRRRRWSRCCHRRCLESLRFKPTDSRPLALVRICTAAVALALWWGYAADLQAWFGPAGEHFSIDRWLGDRAGRPAPGPSVRASIAGGLLKVHASAIAVAAVLAQLKGDAWWNGLAS